MVVAAFCHQFRFFTFIPSAHLANVWNHHHHRPRFVLHTQITTRTTKKKPIRHRHTHEPALNSANALRQLYSAESTCNTFNRSTCPWNSRICSINAITRSAAIGELCKPAAASNGAACNGIPHCAALNTNSSAQLVRNSATCVDVRVEYKKKQITWSAICNSGKNGMFRDHSTAENSSRAASSHILSIPITLPVPVAPNNRSYRGVTRKLCFNRW